MGRLTSIFTARIHKVWLKMKTWAKIKVSCPMATSASAFDRGFCKYTLISIIVFLSDILVFRILYLSEHKVQMHARAIRQLWYGCAYLREIIHSLKLVDYLHTITYTCLMHQPICLFDD